MSDTPTYVIKRPLALVLLVGVLAILALNVALILQNRTLKRDIVAPPALLPQVGTTFQELEGVGLDGSKLQVSFARQRNETLLFVFSTRCGVCTLNWPHWQSIARALQGRPVRLVYANIQSPFNPGYAGQYGIRNATVFAQLDPRYEAALNLQATPITLLVSTDGRVDGVWAGLLEDGQLSDLLRTLGIGSL